MRLLVGADRELRDVRGLGLVSELELHVRAARAALLPRIRGEGLDVRHKVRLPGVGASGGCRPHPALALELLWVADAVFEDVGIVEDEALVVEKVHGDGGRGHRDEARGLRAAAVQVLMPDVDGDGENAAALPLEADAAVGVVADEGRAASFEHVDVLLEDVLLRGHLAARRYLRDVGAVGVACAVEVDVRAEAVEARPRLDLDGAEVVHGEAGDDGYALFLLEGAVGVVLDDAVKVRSCLRRGRCHRAPPAGDEAGWGRKCGEGTGAGDGIRTHGPLLGKQMLYP